MERLKGMEIPWEKSREEVWATIESQMGSALKPKGRVIPLFIRYAAAAVLMLAVGTCVFMRLYQTSVVTLAGEQLAHTLPDGSVVELNAGSSLSYHPWWFRFNRSLDFEGEAFFEVEKGKHFAVESSLGKTTVLGTSFAVFAREEVYSVTCHTGKVNVAVREGESVLLTPTESARYEAGGALVKESLNRLPEPAAWKKGQYSFTGADRAKVIKELERYFDVQISLIQSEKYSYSGDLDFTQGLENTLRLVCTPFTLTFVKINKGEYKVLAQD